MGELAALSSSVCWAVASLIFLRLRSDLGATELNFLKCVIALVLFAITALIIHGTVWIGAVDPTSATLLGASGVVGLTIGDTFYFLALTRIGPRRTLLLGALSPPFTAILAVLFLSEAPTWALVVGMVLTLGGVSWVIAERTPNIKLKTEESESKSDLKLGVLFGIVAAICQATGNVLTKAGSENLDALQMSNIRLLFGCLTLGLVLLATNKAKTLPKSPVFRSSKTFGLVLAATIIGTYVGIWLQVAGLAYAHTAVAATLSATSPLFVLPMSAVVLKDRPSPRAILGAIIAVAGVGVLFF